MSTDYVFRVSLIVPSDRKAGLNTFIRSEFDDHEWLLVELSPTGKAPATHYGTCFACTMPQSSTWAERLTSEGGVPLPPEFAGMNADQRIQFMEGASPALKQLTGVVVRVCRNDAMPWAVTFDDVLTTEGLKRAGEVAP
jgi:hypothetical protein